MKIKYSSISARGSKRAWPFLLPGLAGVSIFVVLPFLDTVRRSGGPSVYREVLENRAFRLAAGNTLRFMGTALPLLMAVSFLLSLLVYRCAGKRSLFKTVLVLPVAVPAAGVVLLWRMVFCRDGILNGLTGLSVDWIRGPQSFAVLVFVYLWKNVGYQMLLWLAALAGIPDELYEAAEVDGAGELKKLLYITIPQVKRSAGMILFLAVINSFKVFREAYIVAGPYPHERLYLLQHLFNHWFLGMEIEKMSAAAVLLTAVIGGTLGLFAAAAFMGTEKQKAEQTAKQKRKRKGEQEV